MSAPKCEECSYIYTFPGTSLLCCASAAARAGEYPDELGIPVADERATGACGPSGEKFLLRDKLSQP